MSDTSNTKSERRRIGCLIPALGMLTFFVGCTAYFEYVFDPCEMTTIDKSISPNKKWSMEIYSVDCGATTPFYTLGNLVPNGHRLRRGPEQRFLSLHGLHNISTRWLDIKTVEIIFEGEPDQLNQKDIHQMEKSKDGVTIIYNYSSRGP